MTNASDWCGKVGDGWAREWPRTERSFTDLAPHLTRAILSVAPDHGLFLDLGCGVGSTAAEVANARPAASVLGVDLSEPMIAIARERYRLSNLRFVAGDVLEVGRQEPAPALIFSRHGVMFFADPATAFADLRRDVSPGAPLVFSCFGSRRDNVWAAELDEAIGVTPPPPRGYAPGPFAFGDPAYVSEMMARAGWRVATATPIAFSYVAGEGRNDAAAIADAIGFFGRIGPAAAAIRSVGGEQRAALFDRIGMRLARYARSGCVAMPASAWIWTAHAEGKPA
ncbi:class I SAM-dependent methyltransferase [Sphingomonas sp. Mn802worker]|uniref:class I SAM-dependent methyltransferase n=1 Tax=Sphingomonas sp. Mn802worker TaxID=629773 RepID=UPI000476EFD6|nr:class I SAM-dependent methyltransferase [Sphingomonas sp. Mn802worker]